MTWDRITSHLNDFLTQLPEEALSDSEKESLVVKAALGAIRGMGADYTESRVSSSKMQKFNAHLLEDVEGLSTVEREQLAVKVQDYLHQKLSLLPARSLSEDYGHKHANLVKLATMAQGIEGVVVPLPFGLSGTHVLAFLEKTAPEIFIKWKELGPLFSSQPEKAQQLIGEIHQHIEKAFATPQAFALFPEYEQLIGWLEEMRSKNSFLMVRSTGSEDTEIANAGGNKSVAYVPPEAGAVFKAVGEVVASYFSFSSLTNRINAGDNPFASPLKMAVTMQELIGEPVNGEQEASRIPVSMVLFTNEPYYVGAQQDAEFRVMRISACLGHGEGVVQNQGIPADTILALQSRTNPEEIYCLYDNQPKAIRLMPKSSEGTVQLQPQQNPEEISHRPALDLAMVKRLFDLGVAIETKFAEENQGVRKPIDMELVVKDGVIHMVQARGINRKITEPTYVDISLLPSSSVAGSVRADKILVAGTSSVTPIAHQEEILVTNTLEEAEKRFTPGLHKLVVVKQDEPPLSHPVVNFSGLGIPCFLMADPTKVQKSQPPFLVCLQEGVLYPWLQSSSSSTESPIKQGYTTHPAPIQISLLGVSYQPMTAARQALDIVPDDLKELLTAVRAVKTRDAASIPLIEHPTLQTAKQESSKLIGRVSQLPHVPQELNVMIDAISQLSQKIEEGTREFQAALKQRASQLEMLLHAKVLTQLISQEQRGVGQLSLSTLPQWVSAAEFGLQHQEGIAQEALLTKEAMMATEALNPRVSQTWLSFLKALESLHREVPPKVTDEQIGRFKVLMNSLGEADAVSFWLSTVFIPSKGRPEEVLKKLLQEEISAGFLQQFKELKNSLHQMEQEIPLFSDPVTFDAAMGRLKALSTTFSHSVINQFQTGSKIEKLLLLPLMERSVHIFDASIKSMKVSSQSDTEKKEVFRGMLGEYLHLFESWVTQLFPDQSWGLSGATPVTSQAYTEMIRDRLERSYSLLPSLHFSVDAAVLGTGVNLERHLPETLEDCFTLIHQNLINLIRRLNAKQLPKNFIESLKLPPAYSSLISANQLTISKDYDGDLVSVQIHPSKIELNYNVTLRNHSAAISLVIDPTTDRGIVKISLYGEQRFEWEQRWDKSLFYLLFHDALNTVTIHGNPSITDKQMVVELEMSSPERLPNIMNIFDTLLDFSFTRGGHMTSFYERRLGLWVKAFREEYPIGMIHDCLVDVLFHRDPLEEALLEFYLKFLKDEIAFGLIPRGENDPEAAVAIADAIVQLVEKIGPKNASYIEFIENSLFRPDVGSDDGLKMLRSYKLTSHIDRLKAAYPFKEM